MLFIHDSMIQPFDVSFKRVAVGLVLQVRSDWGIKESVGIHGWQAVMKQYLRQDRLQGLASLEKLSSNATPGRVTSSFAQDDGNDTHRPIAACVPCLNDADIQQSSLEHVASYVKHCTVILLAKSTMAASKLSNGNHGSIFMFMACRHRTITRHKFVPPAVRLAYDNFCRCICCFGRNLLRYQHDMCMLWTGL